MDAAVVGEDAAAEFRESGRRFPRWTLRVSRELASLPALDARAWARSWCRFSRWTLRVGRKEEASLLDSGRVRAAAVREDDAAKFRDENA